MLKTNLRKLNNLGYFMIAHYIYLYTYIYKLYGPFLWMGFNCLKATDLLFTTKFPEICGTH